MKSLRSFLFIVISIISLLLVIGFILPTHVRVERSRMIKSQPEIVFEQINSLKNWTKWATWLLRDSAVKISLGGPPEGPGSALSYTGSENDAGKGIITILGSVPNDSVVLEMNFLESGKSTGIFRFTNTDSGTLLTMAIESNLGHNPVTRWFGLFMDRMIGKELEKSLENIEIICKLIKNENIVNIINQNIEQRIIVSIRDTSNSLNLSTKLDHTFQSLYKFIHQRRLKATGAPFVIYHELSAQSFDFEAGIPVDRTVWVPAGILCREMPSASTIMATVEGSYDRTVDAYNALQEYADQNKLTADGPVWEEYISDPAIQPDSAEWQINVYFPYKND